LIHGNDEGIIESRERINDPYLNLSNNRNDRNFGYDQKIHDEIKRNSATTSGDRAVFVALCTNFLDTISKFVGAYFTGSLSLFSEFCHSLCDTFNTIVLYLG
jgi:Co/Zn/Cd efflux system component